MNNFFDKTIFILSNNLFISIFLIILFLILIIFAVFKFAYNLGKFHKEIFWKKQLPSIREDAANRSRAVLAGKFSEQLAPFLPNFRFNPGDCKFLGQPIDFIVFNGMDEKNISEVIFVEVKSGTSGLSQQEKNLRDAIENKRVKWVEYRIDENLTK